jgi:catechol 2,3-dioxygenase-like lactoylglutathione lyase family enzyme
MSAAAKVRMHQVAPRPDTTIPVISRLHHYAYRCKDSEETRHFYEDLLGIPLARIISHDHVPSTGEYAPYCHLFFELGDGSYIAFFDIFDDKGYMLTEDAPEWLHHIALMVNSEQELLDMKARLEAHGLSVLGPVRHTIMSSIYFVDPNGHRLELVWEHDCADILKTNHEQAHQQLKDVLNKYVPHRPQRNQSA